MDDMKDLNQGDKLVSRKLIKRTSLYRIRNKGMFLTNWEAELYEAAFIATLMGDLVSGQCAPPIIGTDNRRQATTTIRTIIQGNFFKAKIYCFYI